MTTLPRRSFLTLSALGAATLAPGAAWASEQTGATDPAGSDWYTSIRDAIAGLPDAAGEMPPTATAAQVRVTRAAQTWEGRSGLADIRTGHPVPDVPDYETGEPATYGCGLQRLVTLPVGVPVGFIDWDAAWRIVREADVVTAAFQRLPRAG